MLKCMSCFCAKGLRLSLQLFQCLMKFMLEKITVSWLEYIYRKYESGRLINVAGLDLSVDQPHGFDFGFWDPAIYLAESCSLSCSCIIRIRKKSIRVLHYEYCLLLLCPRHSSSRTYYDVEWIYHKGHLQKFFLTSAHFNLFFIFSILALLDKSIFGFVKWKWYESVLC